MNLVTEPTRMGISTQ